jgi:hypothetical protein
MPTILAGGALLQTGALFVSKEEKTKNNSQTS